MHISHRLLCALLRSSSHIPAHVAFIMDGNRRYAKQCRVRTLEGHTKGYEKMKETLEWCLHLGVRMVTVYAFATDNFKRSPEEVEQLMRLAKEKFVEMIEKLDIIERHGCCIRVLGNLSLLPADVRAAMEGAVAASRHNTKVVLNICMSYSHQQEMTDACEMIGGAIREGIIMQEDVDTEVMQSAMYTGISAGLASDAAAESHTVAASSSIAMACESSAASSSSFSSSPSISSPLPPSFLSCPDLLIRTSGETRLSDFLCSQLSHHSTHLVFISTLWPQFSFLEMGKVVLEYQRVAAVLEAQRGKTRRKMESVRTKKDEAQARRMICEERMAATARSTYTSQQQLAPSPLLNPSITLSTSDDETELETEPEAIVSLKHISSTSSSSSSSSRSSSGGRISDSALTTEEDSNSDGSDDIDLLDSPQINSSSPSSTSASSSPATHASRSRTQSRTDLSCSQGEHEGRVLTDLPPIWQASSFTSLLQQRFATGKYLQHTVVEKEEGNDETDEIDAGLLEARARQIREARQARLRAFALYTRAHTTSLI